MKSDTPMIAGMSKVDGACVRRTPEPGKRRCSLPHGPDRQARTQPGHGNYEIARVQHVPQESRVLGRPFSGRPHYSVAHDLQHRWGGAGEGG